MTRRTFDGIHEDYETVVERSIDFSGLRHDFFMAAKAVLLKEITTTHFQGDHGPQLLDVGCGVGRLHPHLRADFPDITGCDVSGASIERARRDHPFARYVISSPHGLPFDDGSFDIALTVCVMHHVPPNDWGSFLMEMRRVVRPGGLAVVIEHNPFHPLTRLAVARCPFDADAVLLSGRTLTRLMVAACFRTVRVENFLFFPTGHPLARRAEWRLAKFPLGAQYAGVGTV